MDVRSRELEDEQNIISSNELQVAYNRLYKQLRNYIWGYKTVEKLADLEVEVYQACPDLLKVRGAFYRLYYSVYDVAREDEDLEKVVEAFKSIVDNVDTIYTHLNKVNEVVSHEDIQEKLRDKNTEG